MKTKVYVVDYIIVTICEQTKPYFLAIHITHSTYYILHISITIKFRKEVVVTANETRPQDEYVNVPTRTTTTTRQPYMFELNIR